MLFDLQGRRRRVVQATYLSMAVLMGGGLVLFGIGGDVSFNVFEDAGGGGNGNSAIEDQLEDADGRLRRNPRDAAALLEVVRGRYQLATQESPTAGTFTEEGKRELQRADEAWRRYLDLRPDPPNGSVASLMVEAYGPGGLNQPQDGLRAAQIVADVRPSAAAYLQVAQFAALAGDERRSDRAGRRALQLAEPDEREAVPPELAPCELPLAERLESDFVVDARLVDATLRFGGRDLGDCRMELL